MHVKAEDYRRSKLFKRRSKMTYVRILAILLLFSLAGLVPRARADDWHKTTLVTVNKPIELPGTVLEPGTYTFRLVSPNSHIVQIWNAHRTRLYTSIMTIPDARVEPAEHTILKLTESRKGALPELQAWFYPGDSSGEQFVYSHSPDMVAGKTHLKTIQPVG
jgi:hypothetical protein